MERPFVLVGAAEAEFVRHFRAVKGHVAVVEGAPEAVVYHQVEDRARGETHPASPAHLGQAERGVGHALLAAGDADVGPAKLDHLAGEIDRLDPGGADFVYRDAGDCLGEPCQDRRLTARNLAAPGGDDLPHEDVVHVARFHLAVCPAENLLNRQGAELGSRESFQRPAEAAVGGPAGFDEDDFPKIRCMLFLPVRSRKIGFSLAKSRHGKFSVFLRQLAIQFLRNLFHAYSPSFVTNSISRGTLYEER